jgi:hypothetical protein
MKMINIKKVLSEHKIHYVEHGHNVAKGNVNIKCPMCGSDDKSEHMGIRLSDGYWGCWRNEQHRGKNLYRLLAILEIFITEEKSITINSLANRTFFNTEVIHVEESKHSKLLSTELPRTFVRLDDSVLSMPYINYLSSRGFDDPYRVANEYNLVRDYEGGKWSNRLIIPININEYICWTGRSINNNPYRYLSPDSEEDNTINIKDCIFNYNELSSFEGETLVINEGPFDSLKVDYYLKPEVRATCLFGLSFKEEQLKLLEKICYNFNNILIGFDVGALLQSLILSKRLRKFSPNIIQVPDKDFGIMNPTAIRDTIYKYK